MGGKEIKLKARDGTEKTLLTYGGLVRTGGERCSRDPKYGCRDCTNILC